MIADRAAIGDLSELMLRFATAHDVEVPSSFHGCIHLRSRQRQLTMSEGHDLPEWILNSKTPGNEFADLLGLHRPWRSPNAVSLDEAVPRPGMVLKPLGGGGARGVFAYEDDDTILEIGTGRTYNSIEKVRSRARELLEAGTIPSDAWVLEEVVLGQGRAGLARDLKFYTFYGRVGLALEIDRFPAPQHCWWTREGEAVDVGKYRDTSFAGTGPTPEDIALAEWVSAQIPAPFIRIDFLVGHSGALFGEFTARPGGLHQFRRDVDRWLGDEFQRAQVRLEADLAAQQTFEQFARVRPPVLPSVFAADVAP